MKWSHTRVSHCGHVLVVISLENTSSLMVVILWLIHSLPSPRPPSLLHALSFHSFSSCGNAGHSLGPKTCRTVELFKT